MVTGAAGMIGSALLETLDATDVEVWTTARQSLPRSQHIVADLEDPESAAGLAELEPQIVIHLAGSVGPGFDTLFTSNVLGTVSLLESLPGETRVVVAGSAAEYGIGDGNPLRESDPLHPVRPYGWAKVVQTTLARAIAARRFLRLTIVRPFNIVGPKLPTSTALGNIAHQLEERVDTAAPTVTAGRLDVIRDYVPLGFVASAFQRVALDPESPPIVNICSGIGIALGDVLLAMGEALNVTITEEIDPALAAIPAGPAVIGDPSVLRDRFELTVEMTPQMVAATALGLERH